MRSGVRLELKDSVQEAREDFVGKTIKSSAL
jgi:hypothetical protein